MRVRVHWDQPCIIPVMTRSAVAIALLVVLVTGCEPYKTPAQTRHTTAPTTTSGPSLSR